MLGQQDAIYRGASRRGLSAACNNGRMETGADRRHNILVYLNDTGASSVLQQRRDNFTPSKWVDATEQDVT